MKYVGARYVPKFSNDPWDITTSYENLVVVDNGMGTSYISQKPVPAGIPLNDTDYWHIYGASSGAIINLQNQIDNINVIVGTPEEYGAAGDGLTDDTAAVQNCVDNCKIALLDNTYLITASVNIPAGVQIIGSGTIKANSIFDYLVLNGDNLIDGITFSDTNSPSGSSGDCIYAIDCSNLDIKNCKFDTVGAGCCILFEHCERITVEHNYFHDYGFSGVMLKATCKYANIQFNYLENSRYMGGQHSYPICFSAYDLVEYGPAEYVKINYNTIIETTPHWEGIDSHGAKDYEIIGNRIMGTLSGMNLGSTPTSIAVDYTDANHNCIIADNYIDVGSSVATEVPYGIQLSEQSNCQAENVILENNYIKVTSANTATSAACSGVTIRGNGGSNACQIKNNKFNVYNRHCIAIDYGKHENLLVANNVAESMTTDGNTYYFFTMDLVNDYENIVIRDNTMMSAFTGANFFRGVTGAPTGNKLIEISGNDDKGLPSSRINYSTYPDTVILAGAAAIGVAGQFKPNNGSNTVAGWLCKAPGSWVELSGTNV